MMIHPKKKKKNQPYGGITKKCNYLSSCKLSKTGRICFAHFSVRSLIRKSKLRIQAHTGFELHEILHNKEKFALGNYKAFH